VGLKIIDARAGRYLLNQKNLVLTQAMPFETRWQTIMAALPQPHSAEGFSLFSRAYADSLLMKAAGQKRGPPITVAAVMTHGFVSAANEQVACAQLENSIAVCHNYENSLLKAIGDNLRLKKLSPREMQCKETMDRSAPCILSNADSFLRESSKPVSCSTSASNSDMELKKCLVSLQETMVRAGWTPPIAQPPGENTTL
jgi:hypothetical protein